MVPIVIRWSGTREVVKIDLDHLRQGAQVIETNETELVDGQRRYYQYRTTSELTRDGGTLIIHYRKSDNPHLKGLGCRWGRSIITLSGKMEKGRAEWVDDHERRDAKGRKIHGGKVTWRRLSSEHLELTKRERQTVERIARRQAQFKLELLLLDPRCAITGESQEALLEAAHILPAASNGADVANNGLLLRVDLHRLFDASLFAITGDGEIVPSPKLTSREYQLLLRKRSRLEDATFLRVRDALMRRQGGKKRTEVRVHFS